MVVLSVCSLLLHAQTQSDIVKYSKMNISLQKLVREMSALNTQAPNVSTLISVLVKGDMDEIKTKTAAAGGRFLFAAKGVASIQLPLGKVMELAEMPSVSRIENSDSKLMVLNDAATTNNNVDFVHRGVGLPQGYDGKGVVVGIIDEGIDWRHPDFRNLDGTTRIKYLWDQGIYTLDTNVMPHPYNYGMEYVGSQIDTSTLHKDTDGHGTHVAGIACGNGQALMNYYGMAPASDIIVVKMDLSGTTNTFLNSLADAVKYIFDKADSLNEPAVVNISLGTYFGSHDGKDAQSQVIGNLVEEHPGRVVVAAAGNAGYATIHMGYSATTDTAFTWFQSAVDGAGNPKSIYLDMWGNTGDFDNVQMAIGIDEVIRTSSGVKYRYRGSMPFKNVTTLLQSSANHIIKNSSNQRLAIVAHQVQIVNGSYEVELSIKPDSASSINGNDTSAYRYRLMATGSGRLDVWSFDMVSDGLPDAIAFPPIAFYKKPDSWENMVSSFQCNDNVITVGSYDNRRNYTNANFAQTFDTLYSPFSRIYPGALSGFSSHGPTRDGRTKPDVTAPGGWVLSAGPDYVLNSLLAIGPEKVAAGRMHFRNSGTSMASPMVAGICALYLQKNPTATWLEVKNALINCTNKDSYKMLTGCAIGINEANSEYIELRAYPNPFNDYTMIAYDLSALSKINKAEVRIVDAVGKVVKSIAVNDRNNTIKVDKGELKSGVYFYSLLVDGKSSKTNKLIVM